MSCTDLYALKWRMLRELQLVLLIPVAVAESPLSSSMSAAQAEQ